MIRVFAVLVAVLAVTGCDESPAAPCLAGDVTGDGVVNVVDAQQIARWSAGLDVAFPIGGPGC